MKALVGAFNQEKALVGAFSVIVQPVVEPMDRFAALSRTVSGENPQNNQKVWEMMAIKELKLNVWNPVMPSPASNKPGMEEYTLSTGMMTGTIKLMVTHGCFTYFHLQ